MAQPPLSFHRVQVMPDEPEPGGVYFFRRGSGFGMKIVGVAGMVRELNATPARFEQTFPVSAQWIVNHNLGAKPAAVRLLTVGGVEFDAMIIHASDNQFIVGLSPAVGGQVIVQ